MQNNDRESTIKNRRKLLSLLGVGAIAGIPPVTWYKPVVKAVFLPAHAQTSYTLTCVANPPSGSSINSTDTIDIVVTVLPNPGPGQLIGVGTECAGFLGAGGGVTDANGQVIITNSNSPIQCPASGVLRHTFHFMDLTADCYWNVTFVGGG